MPRFHAFFAAIIFLTSWSADTFAGDNTGRTLYDRNRRLREYQAQRGEPCGRSSRRRCYLVQDKYGNYYYSRRNPYDTTYTAPNSFPDNAGNESR